MMRWLVALACAGCSFKHGTLGTSSDGSASPQDARTVDALDARMIDAPPMWVTVETLSVPCSGAAVASATTLVVGVTYHLHATGECVVNVANSSAADAEYIGYNVSASPVDVLFGVDLGIGIDDPTNDNQKSPSWGPFTTSHDYQVDFIGTGATITATFHDTDYTNNDGSLSVAIVALL